MAADENIKTWWSAASGKIGEWLEMDLGTPMELSAIQVSFADESFQTYRRDKVIPIYQYIIEASLDGIKWKTIVDRSQNTKDQIYELVLLDKVIKTRFVRIKNKKEFAVGNFSIADMRLFGKAKGKPTDCYRIKHKQRERQKKNCILMDKATCCRRIYYPLGYLSRTH